MASQGFFNIDQVACKDSSWQSSGGVNELLLLPMGYGNSALINGNTQITPPQQLSHAVNRANSSLKPSVSQCCEQSFLETCSRNRNDGSVQELSLSLSSNSPLLISSQDEDFVNRLQPSADAKNKSVELLNCSKAGIFSSLSRSERKLGCWSSGSGSSGQLKQSKYMKSTRQLLDEFCNVQTAAMHNHQKPEPECNNISQSIIQNGQNVESSAGTIRNGNEDELSFSGDRFKLRKRKEELLWMLDEVERRYRQYSEQMKIIVTCFESAAGVGAATTYTHLAARAMSRHFKCLKDAITIQIKQTNDVLGEKETGVSGITKGETPRLKLIEQSLRQKHCFQQVGMFEHDVWRPQRGLPERAVTLLRAWLFEHFLHPYPSDADKHLLARQTGLSRSQISNWFINARVRLWKPMVEEMYQEEAREAQMEEEDANSSPI
ncbi:hypothetical protein KI387_014458 [Taxus chinensis]|uniref:Homeobox domain-containing protein n=1 Tax=Taxus chinensis TaxID=29808 RepID=A0AA38FHW7_TAXCH|nr:hypothetical protein KI387_014458 [Taxus chinensis]